MTAGRRGRTAGMRRRLALVLALSAVMALTAGVAGPATGHTTRDPILFVHGYTGSAGNWDTMISRFRNDGWDADHLYAFTYSSRDSNVTIAEQVSQEVDALRARTGHAKVDVIAHSMGSLSSRYYLKNLGGQSYVDEWVSLGGPNHGTGWAYACYDPGCYEMRFNSTFLSALNADDETPGSVRYGTRWSSCDDIIDPDDSVILSGASNVWVGCVGHLSLLIDWYTYATTRDFVR